LNNKDKRYPTFFNRCIKSVLRLTFFIIVTLFLPIDSSSQSPKFFPPKFQNLSIKEGLSNLSVHSICQDQSGYIWIGTSCGLNRYDGISFKQYHYGKNQNSLHDNLITELFKNHEGYIFCASSSGITDFYDPFLDEISCFKSNNRKFTHFCDYNNQTFASDHKGLSILRAKEKTTTKVDSFPKDANLNFLISVENQGIWGTNFRNTILYNYLPEKEKYYEYVIPGKCVPNNRISIIKLQNYLVLCISKKLFFFDLNTHSFSKIPDQWKKLEEIKKYTINFISEIDPGILWIGTKEQGLFIYNLSTNSFSVFKKSDNHQNLRTNNLTTLFKDKDNNIWLGTFDKGIEISFEKRKNFNFDMVLSNFTQNIFITSIRSNDEDVFFLGTRGNGLYIYDSKCRKTSILNKENSFINSNYIRSVFTDSKGGIWISTEHSLFLYNYKTGKSRHLKLPGLNNGIVCFCEHDGHLFAGSDGFGFFIYSYKGDLKKNIRKLGNNITQILEKDKNELFISSFFKGIYKYNYKNGLFCNYTEKIKNQNDILDAVVTCYLDSKKDLWIGNFKYGLFRIKNNKPDSLEIYTKDNGLPSNDITGIIEDQNGKIWISTAYGLSCFDKKNEFRNYFYNEGLENIQFHQKAAFIDKHGTLFFGGNYGLTFFNPNIFEDEKENAPKIILESLKVSNIKVKAGDKSKILEQAVNKTKKIELNYHYPSFSIEYRGFDFIAAKNLKYAYKLEGYDKDWIYVDNRTFAGYSNLNPGDYTFKAKVQNSNGRWSIPATLAIAIKPAPWKTWWAFMCYFFLIMALSYIAFRMILRAKLLKKEIKIEHNERVRENDISKMKIKFFNNISHEIRTPLTLIKGNVDYLVSELQQLKIQSSPLKSLQSSTERLLRLINQLLSFRQMENDTLQLEIQEEEVIAVTNNIIDSFRYSAKLKQVSIKIETDLSIITVPLDRDKYEKILSNLISNALKYTNVSGLIIIKIEICKKKDLVNKNISLHQSENFLRISVTDNGKGISPDKLPYIFERFAHYGKTKEKPDYSGLGIGLDFTHRLVEMHQGTITVKSKENKGTCFCFVFPIDKEVYPADTWKSPKNILVEKKDILPGITNINSVNTANTNEKKSVLIAEDDIELNKFIQNSLSCKYKIISAFNGKEAFMLAKNHIPDIIISDIMMPEMSGNELCKAVKENKLISHIPVILLTALSETENKVTGFSCGADEYITKPFDLTILKARIKNLINQRKVLRNYYQNALPVELKETNINKFEISFMKKVNEVVEENYTSPEFNVNQLAEKMNMSRAGFYRKFVSITVILPKNYITSFRINKTTELIKKGEESLSNISYLCGFNSQSMFSVTFKKEKGVTPLQYKKSLQH